MVAPSNARRAETRWDEAIHRPLSLLIDAPQQRRGGYDSAALVYDVAELLGIAHGVGPELVGEQPPVPVPLGEVVEVGPEVLGA